MKKKIDINNRESTLALENEILKKVHRIRNEDIIIDKDLADIYGLSLDEFYKRIEKHGELFEENFRFRVTQDEFGRLAAIGAVDENAFDDEMPYAYTDRGVYLTLSILGMLLSPEMSVALLRAYERLSKFNEAIYIAIKDFVNPCWREATYSIDGTK